MKYQYVVPNENLEERLSKLPKEKIALKTPFGANHTMVQFENMTLTEKQRCDTTLDRKGKPID